MEDDLLKNNGRRPLKKMEDDLKIIIFSRFLSNLGANLSWGWLSSLWFFEFFSTCQVFQMIQDNHEKCHGQLVDNLSFHTAGLCLGYSCSFLLTYIIAITYRTWVNCLIHITFITCKTGMTYRTWMKSQSLTKLTCLSDWHDLHDLHELYKLLEKQE